MPPTGPREHTSDISYRRRERSRSRSPYPGDHKQERGRPRDRSHNRRSYSRSPPRRRSKSYSRSSSRSRSRTSHHRKRQPSRSRSKERGKRRKSRSRSRSSSLSTNSDRDGHRKRHKEKHRKRSRSKERKMKKKEKREKKKNKGSSTSQWGKFGIINESDLYNKEAEFRTWLVEDRMINPETMSKDATKKEFARFMEDFNTATLSHEKYYDMAKYEHRMSLIRNGETLPNTDDRYDVNADLAAHSSSHKRVNREHESYLSKEQLQELRRVQQERFQVGKMKVLGLDIKQTMGVRMDGNEFEG